MADEMADPPERITSRHGCRIVLDLLCAIMGHDDELKYHGHTLASRSLHHDMLTYPEAGHDITAGRRNASVDSVSCF